MSLVLFHSTNSSVTLSPTQHASGAKHGSFMSEAQAQAQGARPDHGKAERPAPLKIKPPARFRYPPPVLYVIIRCIAWSGRDSERDAPKLTFLYPRHRLEYAVSSHSTERLDFLGAPPHTFGAHRPKST